MITRFGDCAVGSCAVGSQRSSAPVGAVHRGETHRLTRALQRRRRCGEPGSYSVSCVRNTCPHDDSGLRRGRARALRAARRGARPSGSTLGSTSTEKFNVKRGGALLTPSVARPPYSTSSSAPMGSRVLSSRGQKWTCRSSEQNATTLPSGEKRTLRTVWPPTWSSVSAPM